jgi:hypothetical protein
MTTMPDIDELVLGDTVARLAIRLRTGALVVHDMHEAEARRLRDQLDDALAPYELPTTHMPPSDYFSQEILDEYDRAHPLGRSISQNAKNPHVPIEDMTAFELDCLDPAKLSADELRRVTARLQELRRAA